MLIYFHDSFFDDALRARHCHLSAETGFRRLRWPLMPHASHFRTASVAKKAFYVDDELTDGDYRYFLRIGSAGRDRVAR